MELQVFLGILIPLIGTALGAAMVFFLKKISLGLSRALSGFAAGVMVAASVWSLLIPAMDSCEDMGALAFMPAAIGFLLGVAFLLILDKIIPHIHLGGEKEGPKTNLGKSTMLILAVAIHNLPEGMAVGVIYAGLIAGEAGITAASALALSIGIAIQNFPEGAIVSMPLLSDGMSKPKAFFFGVVSAIVEVLGAVLTILMTSILTPALPYLLAFAAGTMIYVVVEELIPEMSEGEHSNIGTIAFSLGFTLMMILDVALG